MKKILFLLLLLASNRSIAQYNDVVGKSFWVTREYPFRNQNGELVTMRDILLQKIKIIGVDIRSNEIFPIRYTILWKKDTIYAEGSPSTRTIKDDWMIMPFIEYLTDYDYAHKHWDKKTIACYLNTEPCEGMDADALFALRLGFFTEKRDNGEKSEHGGIYFMTRFSKEYTILIHNGKVKKLTWHDAY